MIPLTRRQFLGATAAVVALPAIARAGETPITLRAESRTIEVNGRAASMLQIGRPDGVWGIEAEAGQRFRANLENHLNEPTLVHWHGLEPPYEQDGVPDISQPALAPGGVYGYDFPLETPGTFWMHSHVGFQEQRLMAAPLIVRDPAEAGLDEQEVVVMLHDFTFRDPHEILAELRGGMGHDMTMPGQSTDGEMSMDGGMTMNGEMDHSAMDQDDMPMGDMPMDAMPMDLNDVEYDAYLANDRTLDDPDVVRVEPGGRVRLRIINGATSTNFFIGLHGLDGEVVAVDGLAVTPIRAHHYPIAVAQRLDIRVSLPAGQGAYTVYAHREGGTARTGIVLATSGATVEKQSSQAMHAAPAVGLDLEQQLSALRPLTPRPADRHYQVVLTGGMMAYDWGINGVAYGDHTPFEVGLGERIELTFLNKTMMAHPMHMHGVPFQVVAINGQRVAGAMRDTVLVPAMGGRVTVAFDATNPGEWVMHCHNLYHMASGMMTTLRYSA
jgi:FtsP/CotA-like multicopper oxidase with cupredoxin domain